MARYADAFAVGEFRALWLARGLSLLGDSLARVAVAVLVYDRTRSPALTGLAYALTFLPYLAGPLYAGIADRVSRRRVMVTLDLLRAALVGAMALPGMPLLVICVLLVVATGVSPLYDAARTASLPDLLPAETYPVGLAVFTMTTESAQVLGFAVGGAVVAAVGAHASLWLDALTYLVAAALVRTLRDRAPALDAYAAAPESWRAQLTTATHLVFGSPKLRGLLALAWLNSLWVVPEGLAAPYAAALHRGPAAVGLLLAAIPCGAFVGAAVISRVEDRERWMAPLALLAAAPLVACAWHPGLDLSLALWWLCGVGTGYNVPANTAYVQGLPNHRRGQAIALVMAGMVTGQGLGIMAGGIVGGLLSPAAAVAGTGIVGIVAVALLRATWLRRSRMIALPEPIDLTAAETLAGAR